MIETSKFKLAYSAEASLAAKAGQSSNKLQVSKLKFWCLIFGFSLVFDFWFLNFTPEGGLL